MTLELVKELPLSSHFRFGSIFNMFNTSLVKLHSIFSAGDIEILDPNDILQPDKYKYINSATSGDVANIFSDFSLADYLKTEICKFFSWIGDVTEPFIDYGLRSAILITFLVMYLSDDYKGKACRTLIILAFVFSTYWIFRGGLT